MRLNASWRLALVTAGVLVLVWIGGRREATPAPAPQTWAIVASDLPGALMSASGTSSRDVYFAGADKGSGPLVVHFDGERWTQLSTGVRGDLWWVHAFPSGPVFFAGAGGMLLRYDGRAFERVPVPGFARQTIYGVWGPSPHDVYAVGGAAGHDGFIWHYDGTSVTPVDAPLDAPRLPTGERPGLFKVWGRGDDVWVVGGGGTIFHKHAGGPFVVVPTMTHDTLFTVHGGERDVVAVGGASNATALLGSAGAPFADAAPSMSGLLQGVFTAPDGTVWASGERDAVYTLDHGRFQPVDTGLSLGSGSLHSVFVDETGGVWCVGGNVLSAALDAGLAIHRGTLVPPLVLPRENEADAPPACPQAVVDVGRDRSIARRWDEQALASIRRDLPRPTVHARNLFHLSAAMWDAWSAYDAVAKGVVVREKHVAADVGAARDEAISYAAFRVLTDHYAHAVSGALDLACYRAVMHALAYDPDDDTAVGSSPRALGNRIARAILERSAHDGANQESDYADPHPYTPVNVPLVVDDVGADLVDANVWQPLNLALAATQNGIVLAAGVQDYVGSQWGEVTPFAMTRVLDPGPRPTAASAVPGVEEVIERSSELDASDPTTIDISPGAYGNNSLGTNDGKGHPINPVTNRPYAPEIVLRGDFGRALAEFWADGPQSETPPGHWNLLANLVADSHKFARRIEGRGPGLDPLAWDVHVYLALNGALHDAAIAAWGEKRRSTTVRPISLIRWMGGRGTLPLVPGLVERITDESSAPGERHAHLAAFKGEIAIRAWRGEPCDRATQASGVGWVRAVEWMPYQRRSFVTPAFPGFISGHSTFSRAGAVVLTRLTGSPYFPGGFAEYVLPKDSWLTFELGPTSDVRLQWATYYDASDQAGQSRVWGGIHISADDFAGRKLGAHVGVDAVDLAEKYFDGTAR